MSGVDHVEVDHRPADGLSPFREHRAPRRGLRGFSRDHWTVPRWSVPGDWNIQRLAVHDRADNFTELFDADMPFEHVIHVDVDGRHHSDPWSDTSASRRAAWTRQPGLGRWRSRYGPPTHSQVSSVMWCCGSGDEDRASSRSGCGTCPGTSTGETSGSPVGWETARGASPASPSKTSSSTRPTWVASGSRRMGTREG